MDADQALRIDFDADALELSLIPQRSALSLAKEAVQLELGVHRVHAAIMSVTMCGPLTTINKTHN